MYYTIELPIALLFFLFFVVGWIFGACINFSFWYSAHKRSKKPVDIYDGLHGQGYQPRPQPPKPQNPKR